MPEAEKEATQDSLQTQDLWVLYTDGPSTHSGSGLRLILEFPTGEVIYQSIRCTDMTNNEAVIAGLRLALKYGVKRLKLHCDSQLVVNQVTGTFQIKEQRLPKYQTEICKLLPNFDECQLDQIPQTLNIETDGLAKLAAATKSIMIGDKRVVYLFNSSLDQIEIKSVNLTWDWRNCIVMNLQDDILLNDKKETKKLRMQAARYNLLHYNLYKRMYGGPLAKCLGPNQTQHVLEEVHEGHYRAHSDDRALVRCLMRAGYYWPTMKKDASGFVKRCKQC
ncbi:uncharacterized protein [Nicotiana sylvestris]|uniref:uncharacterized protein n=1 Tax=Nicotiana sylvestris TaxID=4096 RepID=UPI00388C4040